MPLRKLFKVSLMLLGLSACVQQGDLVLDEQGQPLVAENGLSTNGISTNGISTNGISTNGISTNGLSAVGLTQNMLSSSQFSSWFKANPSLADMVMKYAVKCSCDASTTLNFTSGGASYGWSGELNLAPLLCTGLGFPVIEQQLLSACLAAHVNRYGIHVGISVRGVLEDGFTQLSYDASENATYPVKEGCFFGNLFDGTGVFSGYDGGLNKAGLTSPRSCAMSDGKPYSCLPMVATGKSCASICNTNPSAANNGIWKDCSWGGKSYRAITTRLKPSDVYSCGDGVCQFTESCYDPSTGTGCQADCGTCP